MKILYVYDGDWPKGATRVRKETMALADAGHVVRLLSRSGSASTRMQQEAWMDVRRLPTFGPRINAALSFPLFFNPIWIWALLSECRSFRPDLVLVEDLPLAPLVLAVGAMIRRPVVYDMGEVYPEFLAGLTRFKRRTWIDRILRNPGPAEALERIVLARSDHVFVVSEESRARALTRGAHPDRISVVGNTPENTEALQRERPIPAPLAALQGRPIVLFVGILISDRGVDLAVRAMDVVRRRVPGAVLVVVGEGLERPRIEIEIDRLDLRSHVLLTGWQEHETLPAYYQHAWVGLLPFLDGGQIRYTLANKLFDYMGAGLPVVASDVPPMRRILGEASVGRLCAPGDADSLAEAICGILLLDEEERNRMGQEGVRLVNKRYNWRADSKRLVDGVERAHIERGS